MQLDALDRQIIAATQAGLPLVPKPYQQIAGQLGISTQLLMERMRRMQQQGIIRRIGAVPNHYRLGYIYNGMTVWEIEDEHIDRLGQQVGQLDFVSHCYHRPRHQPEWPYNLFAMVHDQSEQGIAEKIQIIAELLGKYNKSHDVLYSTRILKKTGLRIK